MKYLLIIMSLVLLPNCQSLQNSSIKAEKAAQEYFGEVCILTFNDANTHALVFKKQEDSSPIVPLTYAIYDSKNEKIVFEELKRGGSVEWVNNDYIIVKSSPEVQSIDNELNKKMAVYYLNVKTLKKVYELIEE